MSATAAEPPVAALPTVEITLCIPVATADARVAEVVGALGGELDRLGRTWECVLVFDGVRGPAWEAAEALRAARPGQVQTIAFGQAFGESACLSACLEHARGSVLVTAPQYVQVDPADLERMLARVDAGADFVCPWRHSRVDSVLNRLQSAAFNRVMRLIVGTPFHDLNCTFRVIRRRVLDEQTIYGDMYRFLPVIAQRQGFEVVEERVRHVAEWGGRRFFGLGVYVRRLLDVLSVVFLTKFTLKPLRFFGTFGALLALLGGGLTLALIVRRVLYPEAGLYQSPLFLIGLLLATLGVQIIGFGLVGEVIIYSQARNLREYRIERIYEPVREDDPDGDDDA